MKRSLLCLTIVCAGCVGPSGGYPHSVSSDIFGPGIGQSATGEAMTLIPTFGGSGSGNSTIQQRDAYGPGVHMDQYGGAVSWGGW